MIGYVKGTLTEILLDVVLVECAGVGYEVMVPMSARDGLPLVGSEVKLYTYQAVREDALDLYGFLSRDELNVFKQLITVSGIGPKGALSILSIMTANDVRMAVISGDAKAISKANGIGAKTAQRVIIDLKDKFSVDDVLYADMPVNKTSTTGATTAKDEAIEALMALGYSVSEATRAIHGIEITVDMDSEAILKASLKNLAFL